MTDKIRLERSTLYKVRMPYFLRLSFSEVRHPLRRQPGTPGQSRMYPGGVRAKWPRKYSNPARLEHSFGSNEKVVSVSRGGRALD